MKTSSVEVILVRHGETVENRMGILQGHLPGHLSEAGKRQAEELAVRPPYRVPRVKTVLRHMFDRGWMYIKKAGTYVFAASVLIWALMTFPQYNPTEEESAELMDRAKTVLVSENIDINDEEALNAEYDRLVASEGLKHSFAGKLGISNPLCCACPLLATTKKISDFD